MLIYQSKANLDEKILFGKIIHHLDHLDPETRKLVVNGKFANEHIPCWSNDLLAVRIEILFKKLTMYTSMPHKSWTSMERGILDSHTDPLQAFL